MSLTDLSYTPFTDEFFKVTGFERLPADKPNDFWIIDLGHPPPHGNVYLDEFFGLYPHHYSLLIILNPQNYFTEKYFKMTTKDKHLIFIKHKDYHWALTKSVIIFEDKVDIPNTQLFQAMKNVVNHHLALKTVETLKILADEILQYQRNQKRE